MTKYLPILLSLSKVHSSIFNIQNFYRTLDNSNINYLENYGCWCIFPHISKYGHGQSLDKIDSICKQLHDNYKCLVDNFVAKTGSNQNCDPEITDYGFDDTSILKVLERADRNHENLPMKTYLTQLLNSQCRNKPGLNSCQLQTCLAEMKFVFDIHPQMTSAYDVFIPDFDRNDPLFDQMEMCGFEVPKAKVSNNDINSNNNNNNNEQNDILDQQEILDQNNDAFFPGNIDHNEDGEHAAQQILQKHENTQCCGINPTFLVYNPTKVKKECCRKASALFNPVTEICEGTHVVSLTSELDVNDLVLDLSGNFNNGLPSFGRR